MKRDILGFLHVRRLRQSPAFTFLIAALLCGVFAGGLTGMYIPQANGSYVQELAKLVASNAAGRMPSVRTVCAGAAGTFGWMAAAGVLGAVPGRALWIALLTAVRGFLLSFAAAAALAQSGLWGIYIAFVSIVVATSGKCTSESTYHQSTNLFHFEFLYSFVYRLEILWLYDKESENAIQISDL